MLKKFLFILALSLSLFAYAEETTDNSARSEVVRVRLFFDLSLPSGGAVSLSDWNKFQSQELATVFEGFNVVDSTGFYKGKPERSKIATLILKEGELEKVKAVARLQKSLNKILL